MHIAVMLEKMFDFESEYKEEGMRIKFEYTTPGTPQQNGHVEQKFSTLFNRVCAMINR